MDIITKTLNEVMNMQRAGKSVLTVKPVSNLLLEVLNIMKKEGHIDYQVNEVGKFRQVLITIKRLNESRAIRPRFHFQKKELEKYMRRFLPSRDLGVVIVSTNKGVLTHKEAIDKGLGGILLAYCY